MDAQLRAQLAQSVTIARATGVSSAGDATYDAPSSVAARVEFVTKMVQASDGSFKQTSHWICLEGAVALDDRLWLPGTDSTDAKQARIPLSIEGLPDERGVTDHFEVLV